MIKSGIWCDQEWLNRNIHVQDHVAVIVLRMLTEEHFYVSLANKEPHCLLFKVKPTRSAMYQIVMHGWIMTRLFVTEMPMYSLRAGAYLFGRCK